MTWSTPRPPADLIAGTLSYRLTLLSAAFYSAPIDLHVGNTLPPTRTRLSKRLRMTRSWRSRSLFITIRHRPNRSAYERTTASRQTYCSSCHRVGKGLQLSLWSLCRTHITQTEHRQSDIFTGRSALFFDQRQARNSCALRHDWCVSAKGPFAVRLRYWRRQRINASLPLRANVAWAKGRSQQHGFFQRGSRVNAETVAPHAKHVQSETQGSAASHNEGSGCVARARAKADVAGASREELGALDEGLHATGKGAPSVALTKTHKIVQKHLNAGRLIRHPWENHVCDELSGVSIFYQHWNIDRCLYYALVVIPGCICRYCIFKIESTNL